jgi:hypothetical protein
MVTKMKKEDLSTYIEIYEGYKPDGAELNERMKEIDKLVIESIKKKIVVSSKKSTPSLPPLKLIVEDLPDSIPMPTVWYRLMAGWTFCSDTTEDLSSIDAITSELKKYLADKIISIENDLVHFQDKEDSEPVYIQIIPVSRKVFNIWLHEGEFGPTLGDAVFDFEIHELTEYLSFFIYEEKADSFGVVESKLQTDAIPIRVALKFMTKRNTGGYTIHRGILKL